MGEIHKKNYNIVLAVPFEKVRNRSCMGQGPDLLSRCYSVDIPLTLMRMRYIALQDTKIGSRGVSHRSSNFRAA